MSGEPESGGQESNTHEENWTQHVIPVRDEE